MKRQLTCYATATTAVVFLLSSASPSLCFSPPNYIPSLRFHTSLWFHASIRPAMSYPVQMGARPDVVLKAAKGTFDSNEETQGGSSLARRQEDRELTRRKLLKEMAAKTVSFGVASSAISNEALAYPRVLEEEPGGIVDSNRDGDGEKVVLRTSSSNVPSSYSTLSTKTKNPAEGDMRNGNRKSSESMCNYVDSETRRISVFERAAPSVVYIDTFAAARDAFSTNIMEVPLGAGSGFVWDDRGHIVTNYHVVRSAKSAQVAILTRKLPDEEPGSSKAGPRSALFSPNRQIGSSAEEISTSSISSMAGGTAVTDYTRKVYKARVVGVDPDKDIAVLKIDAPVFDLFPIDVGTSNDLKVGQTALAIGNPFGLDHTLTVGVISGTGREVRSPNGRPISNTIQSDAAINPGNSGGPLLDSSGLLIGMNTAIYSPSGGSAGVGFAIPVDTVRYVVDTLIRDGRIIRPVIGISYLESKQARALGITKGVLVLDVPTSSPAFKAGLRGTKRTESGLIEIGDIIVRVEGKAINTEADLFEALESFKPGDKIRITVNRVEADPTNARQPKMKEVTLTTQLKASSDAAPVANFGPQ